MIRLMAVCVLASAAFCAQAVTYHVRTDGGTAEQCTGLVDAAVTISKACAWAGPLVALPPTGKPRIAGGDTLLIHPGSYMVGYGAPGSETCSKSWMWDCYPAAIPSGTTAAPTRILGDEDEPPELWGTQRAKMVLNLTSTSYAEVSNLEITDHAACVVAHPKYPCKRDGAYGEYADNGLVASDSHHVRLAGLNIHGLAVNGMMAGRLADWTVTDLRLAANGWAGWNGDMSADGTGKGSSNSGLMSFDGWMVEWNGCVEKFPLGRTPRESVQGCWAQSGGGYGDGVGLGETAGDWLITRSTFRNNTSDGLDMLYHRLGGKITMDQIRARGNAGNQIKVAGQAVITNAMIQGLCGFFSTLPDTYGVDTCRAAGDAVVFALREPGDRPALINSTVTSAGNTVVTVALDVDGKTGKVVGKPGGVLKLRNNLLVGLPLATYPSMQSAAPYAEGAAKLDLAFNVLQALRNSVCTSPSTACGVALPVDEKTHQITSTMPSPGGPGMNSGVPRSTDPLIPQRDINGKTRSLSLPDRGALEVK